MGVDFFRLYSIIIHNNGINGYAIFVQRRTHPAHAAKEGGP